MVVLLTLPIYLLCPSFVRMFSRLHRDGESLHSDWLTTRLLYVFQFGSLFSAIFQWTRHSDRSNTRSYFGPLWQVTASFKDVGGASWSKVNINIGSTSSLLSHYPGKQEYICTSHNLVDLDAVIPTPERLNMDGDDCFFSSVHPGDPIIQSPLTLILHSTPSLISSSLTFSLISKVGPKRHKKQQMLES